jgi:alpha-L-fucosidase
MKHPKAFGIFLLCSGLSCLLLFSNKANAQQREDIPGWEQLDARPVPNWFQDAKLGIFIHWGLYSVPAWATNSNADGFGSNYAEWYWERLNNSKLKIHKEFVEFHNKTYGPQFPYQEFASRFTCELFDPVFWANVFKSAGAKYVVLTSKHHDGFALWPSAESWNWNAMDRGPKRDLAGDLSKAVKDAGLKMGFYYSLYEWYNPLYKSDVNKYVDQHMIPQLKDLVQRYKPDIIWPDGEWDHNDTVWRSREFLNWLYTQSVVKDSVATNDRWGAGRNHGGFNTSEYGSGTSTLTRPWEECRGIGQSFGYNRNENLEQYASSRELIHQFVDIVARGGNLLLNIGPAADGSIPVIMQQRLKELGDWLRVNGEGIYGTRAWNKSTRQDATQFFTRKGNDLYLIVTKWKDKWNISDIQRPSEVRLLGYEGKIDTRYSKNTLQIAAPDIHPGNNPCEHAWVFKLTNAAYNSEK